MNLGYELINGDQAKVLLKQYADADLAHSIDSCIQSGKWTFVICSCDTEICVPARIYLLTGRFLYPGPEDAAHNILKCLGCGLCVSTCVGKARKMIPRADYGHENVITSKILLGRN